jgi:hypothetical protein
MADTATAGTATNRSSATGHHRNGWASIGFIFWVPAIFGIILFVLWLAGGSALMNTDASWFLLNGGFGYSWAGQQQATLMPSFNVVTQFQYLFTGRLLVAQYEALFYSVIDFVVTTLVSMNIVSTVSHLANKSTGGMAESSASVARTAYWKNLGFFVLSIALFIWNAFTTYYFGPGNDVAHTGFTLMVSIVSFFFLPLSIMCFRGAWYLRKVNH